jgi:hypothetical protein
MTNLDEHLPTGLALGPMRTGSTWLHEYLLARQDVCLPKDVKETFYFAENFSLGDAWYANYFRHYDPVRHRRILAVAPTLFPNRNAPARVKRTLRNPVLLVTLRRPIDRTWSHYLHLRQYGATTLGFDAAVRDLPSMVEPSLYAKHLARWVDAFGPEAIHITFYDDLKRSRAEYGRQIDRAFDLPTATPQVLPAGKINRGGLPRAIWLAKVSRKAAAMLRLGGLHPLVNAGKRVGLSNLVYGRSRNMAPKRNMRPDTRRYLVERFSADTDALERLLGINLDAWREDWPRVAGTSRRA